MSTMTCLFAFQKLLKNNFDYTFSTNCFYKQNSPKFVLPTSHLRDGVEIVLLGKVLNDVNFLSQIVAFLIYLSAFFLTDCMTRRAAKSKLETRSF